MKIVVTGALGHIGSALIRQLPFDFPEAEIVMVDNMMTQRYASLFDLPVVGRYRFVEADVRKIQLRALFDAADAVVHLAAITDAAGTLTARPNSRPIILMRQRKSLPRVGKPARGSFTCRQPVFMARRTHSCRKTAHSKN